MPSFVEQLNAWKAGQRQMAPIAVTLDIHLLDFKAGQATLALDVVPALFNPMGSLHGGVYADLADAAFGCAIASVLGEGEAFTTVDLHVTFLRRITTGKLIARAHVVKLGKTTGYLEADLVDENSDLVARATSSVLFIRGASTAAPP